MKFHAFAAAAVLLGLSAPVSASAGVYGDDLAKCLVSKASPVDQSHLVLWIFSAMAQHPDVKIYANMSEEKRRDLAIGAGKLMQRLVVQDCRKEAVAAMKYEGGAAMPQAFSLLGQVAMRNLMSAPDVAKGMGDLEAGVDTAAMEALGKEAGQTPPN